MREKEFLQFANCISDPLFYISDDGLVLSFNDAAKHEFQLKSEPIGKAFSQLFHQDSQLMRQLIRECLDSDEPVMSSVDFISTTNYAYNLEGKAIKSSRCVVIRSFLKRKNISPLTTKLADEVKRREYIERQLKYSQAHARAVFETAADGIITINPDGIILSFNAAAETIFDYKAEEVIGENISLFMPQGNNKELNEWISIYLSENRAKILGNRQESIAKRKNGELFHIEVGVSEVNVDSQLSYTGIIRDITHRINSAKLLKEKEAEQSINREKLAHVSRLSSLGELSAGIAHEINQPLTAISNYAKVTQRLIQRNWLSMDYSIEDSLIINPIKSQDFLVIAESNLKISEQAIRAGRVIQRLRDIINRVESVTELLEMNTLIRDSLVLAETDARINNYALLYEPSSEPLYALVDTVQIQQVVLNFVRNGIEAMQEAGKKNGSITIKVERIENEIQVSVIDEGTGITKYKGDQLFDPFFTTKDSGLGLGLSISQNIISGLGGRIGFENIKNKKNTKLNNKLQSKELTEINQMPEKYNGALLYFRLPHANKA